MKCDTCQHKNVCKHVNNMEKFESEIKQMKNLLEYKIFGTEIRCHDYLKEQHTLIR